MILEHKAIGEMNEENEFEYWRGGGAYCVYPILFTAQRRLYINISVNVLRLKQNSEKNGEKTRIKA